MKHSNTDRPNNCEQCFIPSLLKNMTDVEGIEPIKQIIDFSMTTFSRRAKKYMVLYYVTKFVSFVAPLIITTITSLPVKDAKYYIVLLSLTASLAVGIAGIGLFHENWIRYRLYFEQLKLEVVQYVSDTGEYIKFSRVEDKVDWLSGRVSSILKSETAEWKEVASSEYNDTKAIVDENGNLVKTPYLLKIQFLQNKNPQKH